MVERLSYTSPHVAEAFSSEPAVIVEQTPDTDVASQPLVIPALQFLIALPPIENYGDLIRERLRQASTTTAPTQNRAETQYAHSAARYTSKPPKFKQSDLLPAALKAVDQATNIPLLPAPPKFEDAFARFEPMFHTVFYRRYPYHELDDAKQNALLHLWKLWKKDMRILEQSAAYVVQAAVWGASPHRKIQKDKKREEHELPMLKYERYIDIKVADQSRDPGWVLHSDMRVDIEGAIQTLQNEFQTQPDGEAMLAVIDDVIRGRSIKDGQKRSELSTRKYTTTRSDIVLRLKELLKEYA